jgi:hypothetical protein
MTSAKLLILSVVIIVASNVLYHVSQKSIPAAAHPLLSVAVTYAAALLVTLLLFPFSPGGAPKLSGLAQPGAPLGGQRHRHRAVPGGAGAGDVEVRGSCEL